MPFERFTEVGRSFRPRASIRSTGQIGFSYAAVKRFDLVKYNYAVLFFDKETKKIGIKLTKDENEEGAVRLFTRNGNGSISARSFLYYYQISHKKTKQFDIDRDAESGYLIISVEQEIAQGA